MALLPEKIDFYFYFYFHFVATFFEWFLFFVGRLLKCGIRSSCEHANQPTYIHQLKQKTLGGENRSKIVINN
jgi:hypothetical protein